jgi:YggT family protein
MLPIDAPGARSKQRKTRRMTSLLQIILLILDVVWFIVIAHVIMSWLINFNVLNRNQPLVWQIWTGLERLLEPVYGPIRRVLPNMGGLDLSPIVLLIAIYAVRIVLMNNAGALI